MAITFTNLLDLKLNRITNLGAPAVNNDAATKQYVDNVAAGLNWKDSVRAAADTNVSLSSPGAIDGVTLAQDDRVLLMGQTDPVENGIYVYTGSALVRADDASGDDPNGLSELRPGSATTVSEGAQFGNKTYVITTDGDVVIGTTPVTWSLLNAGTVAPYTQGDGIDITNNVVSAVPAPNGGVSVAASGIGVVADPAGGVQVGTNGVATKLVPNTGLSADANGLRFVPRANFGLDTDSGGAGVVIKANSGLAVDATGVQTVLAANKGLTVDATGLQVVAGNGVATDASGVKAVADPAGGLQVQAAGVGAKLASPSGLLADTNGLAVVAKPTGGLSVAADGVAVVAKPNTGVAVDAAGVSVVLRPDDGLDVDATGIGVNTATAGGLATSAAGLGVVAAPDEGVAVDADGVSVVLDPAGGLDVDNLGIKVVPDPNVVNDPTKDALVVSANGVAVNTAFFPRKHAETVGDGSATSIAVTHNLNTRDVQVELYSTASPYDTVFAEVQRTDANTVTLLFGQAPTSGQYRAVVVG